MTARLIGRLAMRALWREIDTFPKPGLVSPVDNGSHHDMDAALLRRSARALQPYFVRLARAGARRAPLESLRRIGQQAERAMLAATGGVNTHRGAIFGLGLLCAAAGLAQTEAAERATEGSRTRASLGRIARRQWGVALGREPRGIEDSHGARVHARYGAGGARAEAEQGFPTLYRVALPALRRARQLAGRDHNAARVQCCLTLMTAVEDTNLLFRGGPEGLTFTRTLARQFIDRGGIGAPDWLPQALAMHHALVARMLSPGGCADLLAMALFVEQWVRHRRAARIRSPRRIASTLSA
jgi:triphosphoribosyl-dephospho-CoA synthase